MNRKLIPYFIFVLIIIGFGGLVLFKISNSANAQENKLWNLQKLEETAEAGNVEAQLRLVDFYKKNINSRDHYKSKLEYWRQKAGAQRSSEEYSLARNKLSEEVQDYSNKHKERQKEMKERMLQLQKKYEKLPPEAQKNEAMLWHDGIKAVFNPQAIYSWKTPFSLKYRLTINIETPEGIKTGSTIQEIFYPPADSENIYNPYNQGVPRGEAAYIDLGERGVVFAVMPDSGNAKNRFVGLIRSVFPTVPKVYGQSRYQEVLKHYDELSGVKDEVPFYLYPMFVHFKDIRDPQSIELVYKRKQGSRNDMKQVDVNRFEELFGDGVQIDNITLEMTDDPLEWKLDEKLSWIEGVEEKDITRALSEAEPRVRIINGIGYYAFRQGQVHPLDKIKAEKKAKKEIKSKLSKYWAYNSYKEVPLVYGKRLYTSMTLDKYLDLLNKYDHIKTKEAHTAAMKSFVTVDTNKDGKISYHEQKAYRKGRK